MVAIPIFKQCFSSSSHATHALFKIHPALKDYIRKESPEENRLLEESLLDEGCRDPLVVWKEENVLVDGHHRFEICERHGIPFQVAYRSFPDIQAVKVWMRTNQLSRRNLDKTERDLWIRELREEGWTQKEIAGAVGVTRQRVGQVVAKASNFPDENSDNSTPTENLEAIIREKVQERVTQLEALYQEKQSRAIAERVKLEQDAAAKRLAEIEAKLAVAESAQTIDQNVIDKLVAEKTAEKISELENVSFSCFFTNNPPDPSKMLASEYYFVN
jgi:ParB-like chromosome segregation protein Spo0J